MTFQLPVALLLLLSPVTSLKTGASILSQTSPGISASSIPGQHVLSNARKLGEDDDADNTFLLDYKMKFIGCHHVLTYNNDEDEDGVKVMRKNLARFRMCPENRCSNRGMGCGSNYGDYVVDMDVFVDAYIESKEKARETECDNASWECQCDDNNRDDDAAVDDNFEYNCEYDCYKKKNLSYCLQELQREQNEQNNGRDENEFRLEEYTECKEFEIREDDDGNRKLGEDDDGIQYYIGPHCAKQGGSIYIGMFTDDTCTNYADSKKGASTYKALTGNTLPYSSTNIVGNDCISSIEPEKYEDEDDGDDGDDAVEISREFEEVYEQAGKCETHMNIDYPVESACDYMEGIKILTEKGVPGNQKGSAAYTAMNVILGFSFCGMGVFVFYLYSKLHKLKSEEYFNKAADYVRWK